MLWPYSKFTVTVNFGFLNLSVSLFIVLLKSFVIFGANARIGYYVNNEYTETELRENPPVKPDFSKVRHVQF